MLQNIGGSSKQLFIGAKDPISRLLQGNNAETKYDTKPNGGAAGGGSYEMDGMQSGGSSKRQSHIDESLQIHSNIILKTTENLSCCGCRKRWQLAILANIGFMIVFGIRCNFGAAKNHMSRDFVDPWGNKHKKEFNWTTTELGVMESSFFYGYLITQVPAGFLAAKFPANKMFGLAIGGASFLNILLPFAFKARSDTAIALIQIMQGLIQGFGYPSMHGVWRYWAPPLERSKLATTAFAGSYAGAVFGLPLSAWLVSYVSWSAPFYIYGIAGVIWAVFWFSMTFEKPAFHPTISAEEKKYIEESIGHVSQTHPTLSTVPWKAILTSKPVYAIIVANFARSWNFYLLLQNQLTYMRDVLSLRINDSGLIAALPHAVMGIVVLTGGRFADYLRSNKILSTTAVRKIFNCGGFGCEAFFLLIVAYTKSERTAILALIFAVGCSGFAISGFNVNHLDIAPRYAAILMGFSNGIGTLAGLICPFVVEMLTAPDSHNVSRRSGWVTVFLLASLIHFTGITFYAIYASGELQEWAEPKDEEEPWNASKQATNNGSAGVAGSSGAGLYGAAGSINNNIPPPIPPAPVRFDPLAVNWEQPAPQQCNQNVFQQPSYNAAEQTLNYGYQAAQQQAPFYNNAHVQPQSEYGGAASGYFQQQPNYQDNQQQQSNDNFTSVRNYHYQ